MTPDRKPTPAPLGVRVALIAALIGAAISGLLLAGAFFKLLLHGLLSFGGSDLLLLLIVALALVISVAYIRGQSRQ
jgi:uncharacterized MnhB-related membrane protein